MNEKKGRNNCGKFVVYLWFTTLPPDVGGTNSAKLCRRAGHNNKAKKIKFRCLCLRTLGRRCHLSSNSFVFIRRISHSVKVWRGRDACYAFSGINCGCCSGDFAKCGVHSMVLRCLRVCVCSELPRKCFFDHHLSPHLRWHADFCRLKHSEACLNISWCINSFRNLNKTFRGSSSFWLTRRDLNITRM